MKIKMKIVLSTFLATMLLCFNLNAQCLSIVNVETFDQNCQTIGFGSATITPTNGLAPYTYQWAGGTWTSGLPHTIENLIFGAHSVTITDSNNCEVQETFNIGLSNFTITNFDVQPNNCTPNELGATTIYLQNGVPPYTYSWNGGMITTGDPSHTINNLFAGIYFVTVTDADGCQREQQVTIEESNIILDVFDFFTCEGECIAMDVGVGGACFPIEYEWYDFTGNLYATGPVPLICDAGTYTCRLIACDGCYTERDFEILHSQALEYSQVNVIQPTCSGGACDGAIEVEIQGGNGNYQYTWQQNGVVISSDQNVFNLCEGLIELQVSDDTGCFLFDEWELNCAGFTIIPYFEQDNCASDCEAFASVTIEGGQSPYQYVWSTGQTDQTIYNLCPDTYSVTVVDASNFSDVIEIEIVELNPLYVGFFTSPASCATGGTIEFEVVQGSGDYSYFFNGTEIFTTMLDNLPPGNATILVVDNVSNCEYEEIIVVGSPYDVAIEATEANCDGNDGTATATIPGGTSTYTYEWSNGDNNATATGLAPGGYSVTVTDTSNDCKSHENVIIEEASDCYVIISGYVIDDEANLDCISDMTSDSVSNQLISLNNTQFTFTNQSGYYSFQADPGTHTITYETESQVYDPLCVVPITVTVSNFGDVSDGNNFFLDQTDITDLHLYMHKTTIRPGFEHFLNAVVYNFGTETVTGSFEVTHDPDQVFVSADPEQTSYDPVTRIITWDYANLNPSELINYQVQFSLPSSVPLGTEISVSGIVSSFATDDFPDNNSKTCTKLVVGSYDPNDKDVEYPIEGWEPHTFLPGSLEDLTYKIRFQNTGTDTAFTVVVEDELDYLIDIRDVIPGPSSHPYDLTVRDGNVLQFNFNNILLPDSTTNEAASHGYVYFSVDLTDEVDEGDMIFNQAAIFFDFNTPIYTNEVFTYFENPIGVDETELFTDVLLQPNPTKDETNLFFELKKSSAVTIELLDISGKTINQITQNEQLAAGEYQKSINTSFLKNGTYFIRLTKDNELITKMLVVIK